MKLGTAFGGGMGKSGETCGAVTGALMIISLKRGAADVHDKALKEKTYELAGEFIRKYRERNSYITCRELLGFGSNSDKKTFESQNKSIPTQCPGYIKDAAEIMEELLRS